MKQIKVIFILLSFISINIQAQNTTEINLSEKYIGEYRLDAGFNQLEILEIEEDGTFIYEYIQHDCVGGMDIYRIRGDYNLVHRKLTLKPKSTIKISTCGNCYEEEEEVEWLVGDSLIYSKPLREKEKVEYINWRGSWEILSNKDSSEYHSDSTLCFRKEYQIFNWGNSIYLLSEEDCFNWNVNDYDRFAYKYNSGEEPKRGGYYFARRVKNYPSMKEFDISLIPKKYQNKFIPIIAEILKIPNKRKKEYKLNKGYKDGVKENMCFYDKNSTIIVITKVKRKISYGKIGYDYRDKKLNKGDKLSTIRDRK